MAATPEKLDLRKAAGFVLLGTGWLLVLAAIVMLKQEAARAGFAFAGIAVEVLGLVLVTRSHIAPKREHA